MRHNLKLAAMTLAGLTVVLAIWQSPRFENSNLDPDLLSGTMSDRVMVDHGWQAVSGQPSDLAQIEVDASSSDSIRLVFDLPGFQLKTVTAAGRQCIRIDVPGLIKMKARDLPELPVVTTTLAIPGNSEVQFRVIEQITREIKIKPVEPSKGHLTRDVDPATVASRFGAFYDEGGVWPDKLVTLNEPFLLQHQAGVNLRVSPLRYDAGRGVLLVTERLVIEVTTGGGYQKSVASPTVEFRPVSEALFGASLTASTDKYQALATLGRMLIIAPEAFAPAATPLVHWKRQRGIPAELVTVPNAGVSTTDIAEIITAAYREPAGLVWVILVGDRAQIPPAVGHYDGSDSDTRYAMLSGADIYPDLFISRISANTVTHVATQVNKFIAYEKSPDTGAEAGWYRRAAGIASDEGYPKDYERADLLRTDLLGYGYGPVDQIYQNQGGSTALISEVLNNGVGLINYLGHGSGYSWESVTFRQEHLAAVGGTNNLPWIIDVSCSNGDIALSDCFAEAWLRAGTPTTPAGAVGMIAATSLAPWTPPTVMQAEVVDMLTTETAQTLGALCFSGLMQVADYYAGLPVAEQVMEQNLIFGDCSLLVRTKAPAQYSVECPYSLQSTAASLQLQVAGPQGSVVTLTSDGVLYATAFVGAGAGVEIPLDTWTAGLESVTVTVTGFNMVPWIGSVTLTGEAMEASPVATPVSDLVTLLGNYPNPFNPRTQIAFELPTASPVSLRVYNIRGQLVRDLSTDRLPAGVHEVVWDGQDRQGRPAPSGVYLYKLDAVGQRLVGRMTLSK